jgi:drug/metabolite transporter (DMT)-like permease
MSEDLAAASPAADHLDDLDLDLDDRAGLKRPTPIGMIAMVIAIISFSLSSPLIKWAHSTGSVIAFWRLVGAVLAWWVVMMIFHIRTKAPLPTRATWLAVLPAALFFGLNIATFFTAITKTSIAHAEFIGALSPLVLVPAGAVFFHERPNWRALRWGGVSIIGMALVLFLGPANGSATLGGDLLMIVVLTCWAGYLLMSKRARNTGVGTVQFMACLAPLALLTTGPIAIGIAGSGIFELSARGWVVVVIMTVLTGMIAHGCVVFAQKTVPIATIGVMQSAQPALAVFWGLLILAETVSGPQVVGMVLVVVGLGLFTWSSQRSLELPSADECPNERT